MGPLHHQVAATMVPLLAARPIASTADFWGFGPHPSLLINHLHCESRRTQGRIGQIGLIYRAPLPQISGRISGHYELTPPVVPVGTFFCRSRSVDLLDGGFPAFSAAASGNRRNRGAILAPPELATIDPS